MGGWLRCAGRTRREAIQPDLRFPAAPAGALPLAQATNFRNAPGEERKRSMGRSTSRHRSRPKAERHDRAKDAETLTPRKIMTAFVSLPRIMRLVWRAQPLSTVLLLVLAVAQGVVPALTAWVSKLLIDAVVRAIGDQGGQGSVQLVIWPVVAQCGVQVFSSLLQTRAAIAQQLLQEQLTYTVQLQVMEKANTLDLRFFEEATFYDTLQQAQREAAFRPLVIITQTFSLGRTLVTLVSMLVVLSQLAWWVALLALLAPIPAFIANLRYGWRGYQLMRQQSPQRREMTYYTTLLTPASSP